MSEITGEQIDAMKKEADNLKGKLEVEIKVIGESAGQVQKQKPGLEKLKKTMDDEGKQVVLLSSTQYHYEKLSAAKDEKAFAKIKDQRLDEVGKGERSQGAHDKSMAEFENELANLKRTTDAALERILIARSFSKQYQEIVAKHDKACEQYNSEWTGGKIVGAREPIKITRDFAGELDGLEKPLLKEKEYFDTEAKVLPDIKADHKDDTKNFKYLRKTVEAAKFPFKGKK